MNFSFELLIVIALVFLFAAWVHGSIGFGFPMVATPLLALFTDIQTAIILTLIPNLLVNLVSIATEGNILQAFRRHITLALLAMTGSAIGTQILILSDSEFFKILLALAIIFYLLTDKVKMDTSWVRNHPGKSRWIFGILAGILGGLTNVMAPVLIVYSLESKHSKRDTIQVSNLCFLLGKIIQLVMFSIHGKLTMNELSTSSLMLIVVSVSMYLGTIVRRKIEPDIYKKLLKGLLLALSILLLIQAAI